VTFVQHGVRVALLMFFSAGLLSWVSARTEVVFADGLRYIRQARELDRGDWRRGLLGSVDHPVYPLSVMAAHRAIGGDGPGAWQAAAQAASVLAGVLLVLPLYLVALELFGARCAWLSCLLIYLAPVNARVMADGLSESTFLLFWTWALWAALRFVRRGGFGWLPVMIGFDAIAYLTRPEGLLLPAALIATLGAMPLLRSTRLNWPRWWAAVGFLVVGPLCLVGPYVAAKGGLGTKPGVARILGTAPKSPPNAVERARPLDPEQTAPETYAEAAKAAFESIRDVTTIPLLPLALLGVLTCRPFEGRARAALLLAIIAGATVVALVRLHATGGYCTPRHAMVLGCLLIPAAASGLTRLLDAVRIPARWIDQAESGWLHPGPAVWLLVLAGYAAWTAPALALPLNGAFAGYRQAGQWLAQHVEPGTEVVDLTGWSLFYGERPGYTFANLHEAPGDRDLRFVVVREAHLQGPWGYCEQVRELVAGLRPIATFPPEPRPGQSRVYVFDRLPQPGGVAAGPARQAVR
jgi:4-amino-4-deoxy-L-arabinose transferase-like glycosyltransferase